MYKKRASGEASHHSSRGQKNATVIREEVVHVTHEAARGQKTPFPGERPGSLVEPEPQRSDRGLRHSSGEAHPTLGLLVLAGASGEAVHFLAQGRKERGGDAGQEEDAEEEDEILFHTILSRSSHLEIWTLFSTSPSFLASVLVSGCCLRIDSGYMDMRQFSRL